MAKSDDLLEQTNRIRDVGMLDTWHFKRYFLRGILQKHYPERGLFKKNGLRGIHNDLHQNR